jgi:large subunit ribosomal protein L10
LAITKQRKQELVDQYVEWMNQSNAIVWTEYTGLTMKLIDELREKIREAGGEFHIVKNTLGRVAVDQAGIKVPDDLLVGSTAAAFAFSDAPSVAKAVTDFAKNSDFVKIKAGYLDGHIITAEEIKALADLPPLPVMRAQLLGVISAPASKLVRTLAEPARQVVTVLQAYSDKEADNVPATA